MQHVLMCRPIHYQVTYKINPWMQIGSVNTAEALTQWERLVHIYKDLGIQVDVLDQVSDLPDMVFAADQGIVSSDRILLSRFRYPERQGETAEYAKWYKNHGLKIIELDPGVFFEGGGETLKWKNALFIGTGFRTSTEGAKTVGVALDKEVFVVELVNPRYYHLDTCLFILNDDTAFYYPGAFSLDSQKALQRLMPNLLEFEEHDMQNFAANSVVVGSNIIIQAGNEKFAERVLALGFTPIMTDVGEFMKAGGGIHCLTGELA